MTDSVKKMQQEIKALQNQAVSDRAKIETLSKERDEALGRLRKMEGADVQHKAYIRGVMDLVHVQNHGLPDQMTGKG